MKCLRLSLFIILLCLTGLVTSSTTPVQTNKLTMQVSSSDFKCMQCCLNWETKALIILVCVFGVGLSIKLIDPFSKQRSPDLPLPVYLLQLIQGQPRHVISPAWPKSGPITQETPIFVRCPNPLNRFLSSLGGEVAVLLWAPRMTYVHISERETSQMMMVHIQKKTHAFVFFIVMIWTIFLASYETVWLESVDNMETSPRSVDLRCRVCPESDITASTKFVELVFRDLFSLAATFKSSLNQ